MISWTVASARLQSLNYLSLIRAEMEKAGRESETEKWNSKNTLVRTQGYDAASSRSAGERGPGRHRRGGEGHQINQSLCGGHQELVERSRDSGMLHSEEGIPAVRLGQIVSVNRNPSQRSTRLICHFLFNALEASHSVLVPFKTVDKRFINKPGRVMMK